MRMPEPMTMRQKGRPSSLEEREGLFRLPIMLMPSTIIDNASVTKPCDGLSKGQLRAKYARKSESSETARNTAVQSSQQQI